MIAPAGALEGRRYLVTGAGAGIGAAIAREIVARGGRVAVLDKDEARARDVAGALDGLAIAADVTRAEDCARAVAAAVAAWGGLDGLVNNAGWGYVTPTLETAEAEWDATLALNLTAPWRLARLAVPHLPRGGAIVNIVSIYGVVAAPDRAGYCASKAGLAMLTRVQALEWAARGVRANAVAPGYVESDEVRALAVAGKIDMDAIVRRTPMGRLAEPHDVARAVCYLLDPVEAAHVTGHVLGVDGGWAAYGYV
jgi:NAD(P)-dependent dehydrogenase (short-subunit alcohol dehydrogenase family)